MYIKEKENKKTQSDCAVIWNKFTPSIGREQITKCFHLSVQVASVKF